MSLLDFAPFAWAVVGAAGVLLGLATLLLALLRRRRSRVALLSGAVMLVGATVLGWQLYRLDQGLEAEMRQSDSLLADVGEEIELASSSEARTDSGSPVPLFAAPPERAPLAAAVEAERLRAMQLDRKPTQPPPADPTYNCHG